MTPATERPSEKGQRIAPQQSRAGVGSDYVDLSQCAIMTHELPTGNPLDSDTLTELDYRLSPDRRGQPTRPLDALRLAGRRARIRRAMERQGAFFLDRFDALVLALIVSILGLTIVDGVLTIELLGSNCEEANPVMKYVLQHGYWPFFAVKYGLTALGLPFLLVFKNHLLFGTRFRVGYVFPVFLLLYLVLVAYEIHLLDTGPARAAAYAGVRRSTATATGRGLVPRPSRQPRDGGAARWLADFTAVPEVDRHHRGEAGADPE
jgi:Domain of unknown function (DUF5658)